MQNCENLVWMDLEMTGLDPQIDRILEIAVIITDKNLNIIEEGPVLAIYQEIEKLNNMDDWNKRTHKNSGLIDRVIKSEITEAEAERICLDFISKYVPLGCSPLCGNSIWQDRRFLCSYMPKLESYFFYRNIDVSSLKEIVKRWKSDIFFEKKNKHSALSDIRESISELIFYRQNVMKI